jgi:hypothetical protein
MTPPVYAGAWSLRNVYNLLDCQTRPLLSGQLTWGPMRFPTEYPMLSRQYVIVFFV